MGLIHQVVEVFSLHFEAVAKTVTNFDQSQSCFERCFHTCQAFKYCTLGDYNKPSALSRCGVPQTVMLYLFP